MRPVENLPLTGILFSMNVMKIGISIEVLTIFRHTLFELAHFVLNSQLTIPNVITVISITENDNSIRHPIPNDGFVQME